MISMKTMPKPATALVEAAPGVDQAPEYPWGLRLCLDTETLQKLGFSEPPAVGTKLKLEAMVEVVSTSAHQEQGGDKRSSCDMQITEMELAAGEREDADPARVMYGP